VQKWDGYISGKNFVLHILLSVCINSYYVLAEENDDLYDYGITSNIRCIQFLNEGFRKKSERYTYFSEFI
jgi:hypothetical protein